MAQVQVRFPLRLLGYDRRSVRASLSSTHDQLRRAEARRDELVATTANVERIGAQVADMLRSLADRAVELEVDAAATAAEVVAEAQREAERIGEKAAAVLASAEADAQQILDAARDQQAAIAERRETALISLQIAIDQMGRLATTVDQIDLTASVPSAPPPPPQEVPETVVVLPSSGESQPAAAPERDRSADGDPIAPALARIGTWTRSTSTPT
jgi:hypothetical protein